MLTLVWPASRFAREWPQIAAVIRPAVTRDPKRDWFDVTGQLLIGQLQAWRVAGGYVVTEINPGETFWVIYAAGSGGSISDKRKLMAEFEDAARKVKCTDMQFEGRDWRKVFPDYEAHKGDDGRFHYRKELT